MATAEDTEQTFTDQSGYDVFFDNICQPCKNDGKILEAEGRCEDCDEYLCKRCFLGHTVPSITRHHVMIDKDQIKKDGIPDRKDQCTQKCPQHDDELIKYYCSEHSFLGCSACMILNHKSCSGTVYIPEVAKDLLNSKEYRNYKESKTAVETKSREIATDTKERMEAVNKYQSVAVEKIRNFKKEVIGLFEKAEAEVVEESKIIKAGELEKQKSIQDKSAAVERDMKALTSQVESFETKQQYCNMYIALMKAKDGLKSCEDKLGEIDHRGDHLRKICFTPNHSLVDEVLSANGIGKIKEEIQQVMHERDIDVNTQSDTKTCWIPGSAILPGNKLVITDCENDKLKMINISQNKVVEELSMECPWDVTVTSSNEVAVTLFAKKIAFVKTDGKLVIHREIDVDGKCRGVAYSENKLVVTFDKPPRVVIMDMQGVVCKTIATHDEEKPLLNESLYVAINPINEIMCISNAGSANVVCVKSDGTILSTYTDADMNSPLGMTIDGLGMVYICDWDKHNVQQITTDCKKARILLTGKDVTKPYTISYCDIEDKFYIGMRGSNIIKVFKVK